MIIQEVQNLSYKFNKQFMGNKNNLPNKPKVSKVNNNFILILEHEPKANNVLLECIGNQI